MKVDFLRLLTTVPRNKRFELIGLINDPDTVAAEKPDQYGLMIDRMKAGTLKWDPEKFGYSSGVFGLQLFVNRSSTRRSGRSRNISRIQAVLNRRITSAWPAFCVM